METPIFQTQKTGKQTAVSIFKNRLEYSHKFDPIFGKKAIPLDQIDQTAFVPKEPGADPRIINLALRVRGEVPVVIKDLEISEAKEIQDILKKYRHEKPKTKIEEHPFTQAGRVIKAIKEKEGARAAKVVKPIRPSRPLNLPFRRKAFG